MCRGDTGASGAKENIRIEAVATAAGQTVRGVEDWTGLKGRNVMGWKNVKEHYRIEHSVQITQKGICIGSPYIHDLIVIGLDGQIKKDDDGRVNEDLRRYMAEMKADLDKLRQLVQSPDTFTVFIPVYTYAGGEILEKQCEVVGWPNVTHDGLMMYENTFSHSKDLVVQWAKRNAKVGIEWKTKRISEIQRDLAEMTQLLAESQADLLKLETDYP